MNASPANRNPKIISTLMLVFLAGAAVGALSMQMGLHEKLHRTVSAAAPRPAPPSREAILQRFKSELNLSGDQTEQLALVLDDYRSYYQNLQDQLDDVRATGKSRIIQLLAPDQRQKFDKIMSELRPQLETHQP